MGWERKGWDGRRTEAAVKRGTDGMGEERMGWEEDWGGRGMEGELIIDQSGCGGEGERCDEVEKSPGCDCSGAVARER